MRLLHTSALRFQDFYERDLPRYAILSHTWEKGELSYQAFNALSSPNEQGDDNKDFDLENSDKRAIKLLKRWRDGHPMMPGLRKIINFCRTVKPTGIHWVWIDTCCINKESSTELSEAINSMFDWYKQAAFCGVFLADVHLSSDEQAAVIRRASRKAEKPSLEKLGSKEQLVDLQTTAGGALAGHSTQGDDDGYASSDSEIGESSFLEFIKVGADHTSTHNLDSSTISSFRKSRWFTRGWTLQELIAPGQTVFYDRDWNLIGAKHELASEISQITGVGIDVILSPIPLDILARYTTAQKMSWAANRETTRIEDMAYSLLGIFGIYMPLQYGEGVNAFFRLQKMILESSNDETILAWNPRYVRGGSALHGIFAEHPKAFLKSRGIEALEIDHDPISITSRGAAFTIFNHGFVWENASRLVLPLNCRRNGQIVGISLVRFRKAWYRVRSAWHNISNLHELGRLSMVPVLAMDAQARGALYVSLKAPAGALQDAMIDTEMMTPCVAIRLTTHMLPWPMICNSLPLAAVLELMGKNPLIVEFQSGSNAKPLGMLDTGKEMCSSEIDTADFENFFFERRILYRSSRASIFGDVSPVETLVDLWGTQTLEESNEGHATEIYATGGILSSLPQNNHATRTTSSSNQDLQSSLPPQIVCYYLNLLGHPTLYKDYFGEAHGRVRVFLTCTSTFAVHSWTTWNPPLIKRPAPRSKARQHSELELGDLAALDTGKILVEPTTTPPTLTPQLSPLAFDASPLLASPVSP